MNSPSLRPRLPTPPSSEQSKRPQSERKQPAKVPPKPPAKPRDNPTTIDTSAQEDNYHILVTGDSLDEPQDYYEELDIDIEAFQRNPAPVWKPTAPAPPHARSGARRWVRTLERKEEAKLQAPALKPPIRQSLKPNVQSRALPVPSNLSNDTNNLWTHEGNGLTSLQAAPYEEHVPTKPDVSEERTRKPGPQSPAKPRPGGSALGFNLKGDPKFQQKLQEKRQELYGAREDFQDSAQDQYEEVSFTATADSIPQALVPSDRLKRPPIRAISPEASGDVVMVENDEGYIDVEPADVTQDEYSEVGDRAPSPSVDWETSGPPLPPRDEVPNHSPSPRPDSLRPSSYRQGSPSFTIDAPSMISLRPGSRGSLPSSPPPPVPSQSKRRVSSPVLSPPPPPLPSREIVRQSPALPEDTPPSPPQRDRPVSPALQRDRPPMALPSKTSSVSPPLARPFPSLPPPSESVDSPPPVPRRHPQHSDKPRGVSHAARTSVSSPREMGEGPPVPQRLRGTNIAPPPVSCHRHSAQPTLDQPAHVPKERSKSSPQKPRAPPPPPKPRGRNTESSDRTNSTPRGPKPLTKAKPAVLPKPKPRSGSQLSHTGMGSVRPKPPPVLPRKT